MKYPYQDRNASEETRVRDLLNRMTLEEKFSQLRMNEQVNAFFKDRTVTQENFETRFSEVFDPDRTSCCYVNSDCDPKLIALAQKYYMEHMRLGIPLLVMSESIHGSMHNGVLYMVSCIHVLSLQNGNHPQFCLYGTPNSLHTAHILDHKSYEPNKWLFHIPYILWN